MESEDHIRSGDHRPLSILRESVGKASNGESRLKLERPRLDKDRLEKLRQYEAHYMEIGQYCADKLEMLDKPTKVPDNSPESHRYATDSGLPRMKRRETNTPTDHAFIIPTPDSTAVNSGELPQSNQARQTSAALSATPSVALMSVESSYRESSDVFLQNSPIPSGQHSHSFNDPEVDVYAADFDSTPRDDINSPIQRPHDVDFTLDSMTLNVAEFPQSNQIRGDSFTFSAPPLMSALPAVPSMIIVRIHNMPFKSFIGMNSKMNVIDSHDHRRFLGILYDDRIVITDIRRRYSAIHFRYHLPKILQQIKCHSIICRSFHISYFISRLYYPFTFTF